MPAPDLRAHDAGMLDTVEARVQRYILDGNDQDLRRLLGISQLSADAARGAFRRIGVQTGWTAIDCGCGPLGGLAVIAEMVGLEGRVVGVDFSQPAVEQARAVVSALGLNNVEVVQGDINELDPASLRAPFDLAYTRLFLMHQPNPVHTLRRIASLLRPGGWLVVHEPLRTPPSRSQPDLPALADYWDLLHQLLGRAGVPHDAVEDLPRSAREAGFVVGDMNGFFTTTTAEFGFELHAATIAAARDRAIASGVATESQVDTLISTLRAARSAAYDWVSTPFFLDLTLRKPASA